VKQTNEENENAEVQIYILSANSEAIALALSAIAEMRYAEKLAAGRDASCRRDKEILVLDTELPSGSPPHNPQPGMRNIRPQQCTKLQSEMKRAFI
jgi:hypothetical protein